RRDESLDERDAGERAFRRRRREASEEFDGTRVYTRRRRSPGGGRQGRGPSDARPRRRRPAHRRDADEEHNHGGTKKAKGKSRNAKEVRWKTARLSSVRMRSPPSFIVND